MLLLVRPCKDLEYGWPIRYPSSKGESEKELLYKYQNRRTLNASTWLRRALMVFCTALMILTYTKRSDTSTRSTNHSSLSFMQDPAQRVGGWTSFDNIFALLVSRGWQLYIKTDSMIAATRILHTFVRRERMTPLSSVRF